MADEIQKLIDGITADIRSLQAEHGSHIVLDPNSEASQLCLQKHRLQVELRKVRGW